MNFHTVLGALAIGGATVAGALSGGLVPAIIAGVSAAVGTLAVHPSEVHKGLGRATKKMPGRTRKPT